MATIFLLTKAQAPQTAEQRAALVARLDADFPEYWYDAGNGCFLVATLRPIITKELTEILALSDGTCGSYIVSNLDSYHGWASRNIWEWVSTMREVNVSR